MNASYRWLSEFVPSGLSPVELRDLITAHSCTVDDLVPLRADLEDVVVGRVVEVTRHPNADQLWLTEVDAGGGELLQVVCGAPNVQRGKLYPFARAGAQLPGGITLERRKIRGVTSNGMLCSARELRLGEEHDGIMELDVEASPGTRLLDVLPAGDTRFVIEVTPNRPDLLSHLGLAREIAAVTGLSMRLPDFPGGNHSAVPEAARAAATAQAGTLRIELVDPVGCLRYMGVVLRGITVAPSPTWLADRLAAVGARPINNVVDVTNLVMYELGQPMHAFDVAALAGPAVVVRAAKPGETLRTLDGVDRALQPGMTVIADAERPHGVAGVMGGAESEVSGDTVDMFLEVATFNPRAVRATRRALGLSTEASYRFERGTDVKGPPRALARAVRLIRALAGGEIEGVPVDLYPSSRNRATVTLRVDRVCRLLGDPVSTSETASLLRSIGFEVVDHRGDGGRDGAGHAGTTSLGGGSLTVTVPSWRQDITREVDLIEEVARLRGYDRLPDELRPFRPGTVPDAPLAVASRRVRETLVAAGLLEARPIPFVRGGPDGFVRVANPLAESEAYLRRDLLDSLARRAEYNLAHMQRTVRLFEIGAVFVPTESAAPREDMRVAALVLGYRHPPHWSDADARPLLFDEWDAKALGETIARAVFGTREPELRPVGHGEVLWEIVHAGGVRGHVRRVPLDAPRWAAPAFGVEVTMATLDADAVAPPGRTAYEQGGERGPYAPLAALRYEALPTTPAAEFDVALLVPVDMPAARVEEAIRSAAGELLERLTLLSEFRGGDIPVGLRSLAWRLTLRHGERTLGGEEVAARRERVLRVLERELGVRQRSS